MRLLMILQTKNKAGLGCEINSAKCINLPVSANQMHNSWIHRKWERKMKKEEEEEENEEAKHLWAMK